MALDKNENADAQWRRANRDALEAWWDRLAVQTVSWDQETVKHLVVLNAAGFAGMATIMSGSTQLCPKWLGPVSLMLYGFGVFLAILNMYLASRSGDKATDEIAARMPRTWDQNDNLEGLFGAIKSGRRTGICGKIAGWTSAIFALVATILVGIGLV